MNMQHGYKQLAQLHWVISPRRQLLILLLFTGFLTVTHLVAGMVHVYFDSTISHEMYRFFNIGADQNLPTLFATIQWLLASGICWRIAFSLSKNSKGFRGWLSVSLISLFIAADEYLMLHERTVEPVRSVIPDYPFLWFAWVIPYGILTLVLAAVLSRFIFSLPRRTTILLLIAGVVFVTGALGFEMLGAVQVANGNDASFMYTALYTCEEVLEMLGVSIFIYTLLDYICQLNYTTTEFYEQRQ